MLTPEQLDAIDQHLRSHLHKTKWLLKEEFVAEITDHYVNAISERIHRGISFDAALAGVYDSFGKQAGLKQAELMYWRASTRAFRRKMLSFMGRCFSFPFIFLTLPAILLFLIIRIKSGWVFTASIGTSSLTYFNVLLFSQNIIMLLAWLFRKRARYFGPLQPIVKRMASLMNKLSSWVLLVFILELFSSPLFCGQTSPYVATLLYTVSALLYASYTHVIKTYYFSAFIALQKRKNSG